MVDLDEVELEVLSLLLYPERFYKIVEECKTANNEHVVADVLKNLLHKKLIVSGYMNENNEFTTSVFYDSDKMKRSAFKANGKGLSAISELDQ
jgi:hypothetical protein